MPTPDRLRRAAYSLKSSSQMFGALQLGQKCKEIEMDASNGQMEGLEEKPMKITSEFEAVKIALISRNKKKD